MKINLFSITYHRFDDTKKSLPTIIEAVNTSKNDVTLYVGDNNSPQDMRDWLVDITIYNPKIKLYLGEKNIGKPLFVNTLYQKHNDCDYIMFVDSDMIADENNQYNFIDKMVEVLIDNPQFGLLSSFQKENSCHILPNSKKMTTNGNTIIYNETEKGIGGGCCIMSKKDWMGIGGKFMVLNLYGYDDAIMVRDTVYRLNKMVGVVENVKLIHPFDTNKDYYKWKKTNESKQYRDISNLKGFFDI